MFCTNLFKIFAIICVIQLSSASVIKRSSSLKSDKMDEVLKQNIMLEYGNYYNKEFKDQIDFLNKVKGALKPDTQRYKDIGAAVEKLELAKQEPLFHKKENNYREMDKKMFLKNVPEQTGLEDGEYQKILNESGVNDLENIFLSNFQNLFFRMAKHSADMAEPQ